MPLAWVSGMGLCYTPVLKCCLGKSRAGSSFPMFPSSWKYFPAVQVSGVGEASSNLRKLRALSVIHPFPPTSYRVLEGKHTQTPHLSPTPLCLVFCLFYFVSLRCGGVLGGLSLAYAGITEMWHHAWIALSFLHSFFLPFLSFPSFLPPFLFLLYL